MRRGPAVVLVLVVLASSVALAVTAPAAGAATSCGKQVVADYFDNNRLDRLYPLHCYEEAIDAIPEELRAYTNAEDAILQAYRSAGGRDRPREPQGDSKSKQNDSPPPPTITPTVDTSATTDVPLPVYVLGALALVLLGAGALGHVSRRRSRGDDEPPPA